MSKRKNGFSIAEVMVATGIFAVAALGIMKFTGNSMKSSKTIESNLEVTATLNQIRGILANHRYCLETLGEKDPSKKPSVDHIIRAGLKKFIVANNDKLGQGSVKIESMNLTNDSITDSKETYLNIRFNKGNNTYTQTIDKRIKILVEPDNQSKITSCRAEASGDDNIWERSAADPRDIHYSSGNVGFGMGDPMRPIHVGYGTLVSGTAEDAPYFGKNIGVILENPTGGNVGLGLLTQNANADMGIQFSHKGITGGWGAVITYGQTHKAFRLMAREDGQAVEGTTAFYYSADGRVQLNSPPGEHWEGRTYSDGKSYSLDINAQRKNSGSGIRILGEQSTAGNAKAALVFEDRTTPIKWSLEANGKSGFGGEGVFHFRNASTGKSSITLTPSEYVGINNSSPTAPLDVRGKALFQDEVEIKRKSTFSESQFNGNITVLGTITASSDQRVKRHLMKLSSISSKLNKWQVYRYKWKESFSKDQSLQIGLMAQEVEKQFPELVKEVNGIKTINYQGLSAILIKAHQEQEERIDKLEKMLNQLVKQD